jgi:DNA-binding GntR family transcriptional regulator
VRLSEKAYHLIKEKILTLELEPLAVIDEQALQEDLNLGRTPIREALHRLASEGLIMVAPRRGMFVADISITDLQKIFEMRVLLEGFCARLAVQRASEKQIAAMIDVLGELDTVDPTDRRALLDIDRRCHQLLYQAANNEFLADHLARLHALSLRLWYLTLNRLDDVKGSVQEHCQITEAIRLREGERAQALVQEHIAHFQQEIRRVL